MEENTQLLCSLKLSNTVLDFQNNFRKFFFQEKGDVFMINFQAFDWMQIWVYICLKLYVNARNSKMFWKSELSAESSVIKILCAASYFFKSRRIGLFIDNTFLKSVMWKYNCADYKFKHLEVKNCQVKTVTFAPSLLYPCIIT